MTETILHSAPRTGDFLRRFGFSAAVIVGILAVLEPLRTAVVAFTLWSVESSARLVGLTVGAGDDGLLTFMSATGHVFAYRIVEECTAVTVVGLFSVAVLAMPSIAWRRQAAGIAIGSAVLLAVNWLRLLTLAWVGVHQPSYFNLAHVWLWQVVGVALVVACWLIWLRWATGQPMGGPTNTHRVAWFFGVATAAGALMHFGRLSAPYSHAVDLVLGGVQRAVDLLPYQTIRLSENATEWGVLVRGVSLALTVALTVALAGTSARTRLQYGLVAIPLVFAAQCLGALLEFGSDARLELLSTSAPAHQLQIPLLVVAHGLPTLIPLAVRARLPLRP